MRKPRRAKLEIHDAMTDTGDVIWLRLSARNGEPLMHSEAVWQPKRARAAILRAMVDVLEDEGLVVLTHSELDELMRAAVEAEDKVRAGFVVTKPEEASR